MTHIVFKRVIGRVWKLEKVSDPKGNAMKLNDSLLQREVFNSIRRIGFGFYWYHPCWPDRQEYLI